MPILAGQVQTPEQPGPVRRAPKRITWTSPLGDVLDLTGGQGYGSMPGRSGFGVPPREVVYDELPGGGGALRDIVDQVRIIGVPLRVQGDTQAAYLAARTRLFAAIRHPYRSGYRVPGTVTAHRPDGTSRTISAYYHAGLDADEDPLDDLILCMSEYPGLEWIALDPYWTGGTVEASWGAGGLIPWFKGMPAQLSPSAVLGEVTTTLPGDGDSYPVWTITGPGRPVVSNLTTGRSWEFRVGAELIAGQTVTVDTRPDRLTVIDDSGVDLYSSLEPYPDLWALESGVNELQVEIVGASSASRAAYVADVRWQAGW